MVEREIKPERKKGFTTRQRRWIERAFKEVLGFEGCVFPVWIEESGEYEYCGKINQRKTEKHHVKPRGWCIRVLDIDPNVPTNGVPLCSEHHRVGQRDKPLTREDQNVIHLDSAWALNNYKGKVKPTSFDRVFDLRKRLTGEMVKYWCDRWDQYLTELVEDVFECYSLVKPDDPWPKRKTTILENI